jgi:hypothetical protein
MKILYLYNKAKNGKHIGLMKNPDCTVFFVYIDKS